MKRLALGWSAGEREVLLVAVRVVVAVEAGGFRTGLETRRPLGEEAPPESRAAEAALLGGEWTEAGLCAALRCGCVLLVWAKGAAPEAQAVLRSALARVFGARHLLQAQRVAGRGGSASLARLSWAHAPAPGSP